MAAARMRGAPNSASNSAFGGPLPPGRLWRFPRAGLIQLVLPRIGESFKGDWYGANVCLLPV